MIGKTISHFHILQHLGSGSMGTVYLAMDTNLGRHVALKVLDANITRPDHLQRFEREARLVASLNHPNIVILHSIEKVSGVRALCMEYVEGKTLNYFIPQGGMDLESFFHVAIPLCSALGAAHQRGMTHRDLKPGNIMITEDGRVKVLDFGLAKLIEESGSGEQLTEEGGVLGSLPYMAPEQLRGEPASQRFDVFSLGSLFYEMLTGRRAFAADRLPAVMRSLLDDMPPAIDLIRPEVPVALAEIVDRCHAKDPNQRFRDANELRAALKEVRDELRATMTGEFQAWKKPFVSRTLGGIALGLLLFAASFTVSMLLQPPPPPEPPIRSAMATRPLRIAVLPFEVRGSEELSYLQSGLVDLLSTKLDGAGALRSLDPRAVLRAKAASAAEQKGASADPNAPHRLAMKLEADRYVLGTVLVAGENLQLSASLYSATGSPDQPLAQASATGPSEEIFTLVDDLAAQLLAGGDHGPGQELNRLAAITTSSLPALKSYLAGEQAFRSGRFQESYNSFQEAVDEDAEFALAWYRLSVAAEWLGADEAQQLGARRALELSDRMAPLPRRLLQALADVREGKILEASRQYHALVSEYPENVEAWLQLGELLFHFASLQGEPISSSRAAWGQVLKWEPDHIAALIHLARLAMLEGQEDEFRSLAERFRARSHGERQFEINALLAALDNDRDALREIRQQLDSADDPTIFITGRSLALFAEDLEAASFLLEAMTEPSHFPEVRATGHVLLAQLALARDLQQEALTQLDQAERHAPAMALEMRAYFLTLPFLETSPEELKEIHDHLETWDADATPNLPGRMAYGVHNGVHDLIRLYLLGLVEIRLGRPEASERPSQLAMIAVTTEDDSQRRRLATDLATGLRAEITLRTEGEHAALSILENLSTQSWLERHVAASPFLSRARERFLRAQCLEYLGRQVEADRWYGSFAAQSIHNLVFLAPALERRSQIAKQLEDPETAAVHQRRADRLRGR